jgi:hypothetical protein
MPTPNTTTGAQKHREETDGGTVEVETEPDTGGGEPDDPDDPDGGEPSIEQTHGGDDDDGSLGGVLTDKRVIAAVVVVSIVLMYFMYQGAKVEQAGGTGNRHAGASQAPDGGDPGWNVPTSRQNPLEADAYVLNETDLFPSIARSDSGGVDDPALGAN